MAFGFKLRHAESAGEIKSSPVVVNQEFPPPLCRAESDRDIPRAAVFSDVQQRLLNDPHEFASDLGRR